MRIASRQNRTWEEIITGKQRKQNPGEAPGIQRFPHSCTLLRPPGESRKVCELVRMRAVVPEAASVERRRF
jgi:hypothetical protein